MKTKEIQDLTLASIFAGIILMMSLIPQVGFITLMPGVSIVLVHIPVLIGVFLLPRKYGVLLGLFFGLGSLIASFIYASQPIDLAFRNPLVSVLPRIIFAFVAYYIYLGLKKIESLSKHGKTIIFGIVTFISIFGIFYGAKALTSTFAFAEHTDQVSKIQMNVYQIDYSNITEEEKNSLRAQNEILIAELPALYEKGLENEAKALPITMPISLIVIIFFLTMYYHFVIKNKDKEILFPSSFILATLIHTVLVLSALVIVNPKVFGEALGFQAIISIIYTIAAANGLVEALIAVFVGTPIMIAINNLKNKNAS